MAALGAKLLCTIADLSFFFVLGGKADLGDNLPMQVCLEVGY